MAKCACGSEWTVRKIAHCAACHQTFTTVANFDRHRRNGGCAHPSTVGLVENRRGLWAAPPIDVVAKGPVTWWRSA